MCGTLGQQLVSWLATIDVRIVNPQDGDHWLPAATGVGGALLGAVVGGYASYRANLALERLRRRQRAAVRRKAKVYTPLRNALADLQEAIGQGEHLSEPIALETPSGWQRNHTAWFGEWNEMRGDGRALSTSTTIQKHMQSVETASTEFNETLTSARRAIEEIATPKLTAALPATASQDYQLELLARSLLGGEDLAQAPGRQEELVPLATDIAGEERWLKERDALRAAETRLKSTIDRALEALDHSMGQIAKKYEHETVED